MPKKFPKWCLLYTLVLSLAQQCHQSFQLLHFNIGTKLHTVWIIKHVNRKMAPFKFWRPTSDPKFSIVGHFFKILLFDCFELAYSAV